VRGSFGLFKAARSGRADSTLAFQQASQRRRLPRVAREDGQSFVTGPAVSICLRVDPFLLLTVAFSFDSLWIFFWPAFRKPGCPGPKRARFTSAPGPTRTKQHFLGIALSSGVIFCKTTIS